MSKARGFQIGIKDGTKKILKATGDAFSWFPDIQSKHPNFGFGSEPELQ